MTLLRTKWLITGANGFLGANAALFLRGRAETIGLMRSGQTTLCDTSISCDLTDSGNLEPLLNRIRPDVVLHTAALSSHEICATYPSMAISINSTATGQLAELSAKFGSRFINISTDAVFDGMSGNYRESDPPSPFSIYGESKLSGENAALQNNPSTLNIRTNFFGWSPIQTRSILEFFVSHLRGGMKFNGFTDFKVTSIYVKNLLESIFLLNSKNTTGTVHIASRDALSKYEFARICAEIFQLDSRLITPVTSQHLELQTPRNRDLSLNCEQFTELTGKILPTQRISLRNSLDEEIAIRRAFSDLKI